MNAPFKMPTHSYIGRCRKCNGVIASIADMPDSKSNRSFTATNVAQAIRDGYIIERVPLATVSLDGCSCGKEPVEMPLPLFAQEPTNDHTR